MKTESQDVKMRDANRVEQVVGVATFPIYEMMSEAMEREGETKLLEYVNSQVKTNELNRVRTLAKNGPGKKAMEAQAIKSITPEEWASFGQGVNFQEFLQTRIAKLTEEARLAAGVGAEAPEEETANA